MTEDKILEKDIAFLRQQNLNLKFVVASTPRSGTTYLSNVFNELGILAGHEAIFQINGPRHAFRTNSHIKVKLDTDVSGFINPYLDELKTQNVRVYHLIRHPVPSINSMLNFFKGRGTFRVGVLHQPHWLQVAELWHYWHKELDDRCNQFTLRLESIKEGLEWLAKDLGYTWTSEQLDEALEAKRGTSVACRPQVVTWDMLPKHIQEFAKKFEYSDKTF